MVKKKKPLNWTMIFFMIFIHAVPIYVFFDEIRKYEVVTLFIVYASFIFLIGGAYHRYFSHKSYKTSRVFQFILAFLAQITMQKGVLSWAAEHRKHHMFADREGDPHSPKKGIWHAHMGWMFRGMNNVLEMDRIRDFVKYKELLFINKYFIISPIAFGVVLYLIGGFSYVVMGLFIPGLMMYHTTWTINSLSHVFGRTRYKTKDTSKNNWFLAIITFGEGWHNNHHHFQASARQGFYWYEYDLTYYILKVLEFFRIIWDVRGVPKAVRDAR